MSLYCVKAVTEMYNNPVLIPFSLLAVRYLFFCFIRIVTWMSDSLHVLFSPLPLLLTFSRFLLSTEVRRGWKQERGRLVICERVEKKGCMCMCLQRTPERSADGGKASAARAMSLTAGGWIVVLARIPLLDTSLVLV